MQFAQGDPDSYQNYVLRAARAVVFILAAGLAAAQDQTFKDAFALYQVGSVEDARKLLLAAARPSALDLTLLGSIEYQEQHFNEAEKYLRRALVLNPALPGAHATLAHVLEAQANLALHDSHDLLRARTVADQAGSFAPDHTGILILRARTRNLQGDTEAALALLLNAEKKTPDNPVLLYATGVLCLQMDLFKDAASYLERAAQHANASGDCCETRTGGVRAHPACKQIGRAYLSFTCSFGCVYRKFIVVRGAAVFRFSVNSGHVDEDSF